MASSLALAVLVCLIAFVPPRGAVPLMQLEGHGPRDVQDFVAELPAPLKRVALLAASSATSAALGAASHFGVATTLSARLIASDGSPLPGARLEASARGYCLASLADADGQVSLETRAIFEQACVLLRASTGDGRGWIGTFWAEPGGRYELGELHLLPGGSLAGRVVDQEGEPLEDARVVLAAPLAPSRALAFAQMPGPLDPYQLESHTRSGGRFEFLWAPNASLRVWAGKERFACSASEELLLLQGQSVRELVIVLSPWSEVAPPEYVVRVLDQAGQLAQGSRLRCVLVDGRAQERLAASGQVVLRQLEQFESMMAYGPDGTRSEVFEAPFPPQGLELPLTRAPRLAWLRIRSSDGGALGSGTVSSYGPGLLPAILTVFDSALASVELEQLASSSQLVSIAIPEGVFRLRGEFAGYQALTTHRLGPSLDGAPFELDLERPSAFEGRVLSDQGAVAGARISARLCDAEGRPLGPSASAFLAPGGVVAAGTSAEDGRYRIESRLERTEGRPEPERWVLLRATMGRNSIAELGPISLADGPWQNDLHLFERGSIRGRLVLPAGRVATGRAVVAWRKAEDRQVERVGADGSFCFERLAPGRWFLSATDWSASSPFDAGPARESSGARFGLSEIGTNERPSTPGLEVEVLPATECFVELPFEPPDLVHVQGRLGSLEAPLGNVAVFISSVAGASQRRLCTDSDGRFDAWIEARQQVEIRFPRPADEAHGWVSELVPVVGGVVRLDWQAE